MAIETDAFVSARCRYREAMGESDLPVLIYDGSCGFCSNAAKWVERHAPVGSLLVRPSQEFTDLELDSLGITRAQAMRSVWWIRSPLHLEADAAIAAALRRCHWPWRLAGILIASVPMRWVAPFAYKIVARHRHHLPGGGARCASPHGAGKPPSSFDGASSG